MMRRGFFLSLILITGIAVLFVFPSPSAAMDELFLSGVVKHIDLNTGLITVDVKSESCRGVRRFKLIDASSLKDTQPGKRISFRIDSSVCKSDVVYKMILPRGTK
jgi:hypothetical protein